MGSLSNFNDTCLSLNSLITDRKLNVFVETGCFMGNTLRYVNNYNFQRMFSCDIDLEMINYCRGISKRLELFHGNSLDFLKEILPKIDDYNVLFYLDAHLPEHDKNNGNVLLESELNFPLEEELKLIYKYRSGRKDAIICDDLRIYEDGPFEGGNWLERKRFKGLDLSFLSNYNYKVSKYYSQKGYLLLL